MPLDTPMLVEIVTQSIPRKDEVFFGRVLIINGKRTLIIEGQPVTEHGTILQYLRLDDVMMSYQYWGTKGNYGDGYVNSYPCVN